VLHVCLAAGVARAEDPIVREDSPEDTPAPAPKVVPPAAPAKSYGPRDVEVRLRDGSRLRGEIGPLEAFTVKTDYGDLKVPVSEMRRLARGNRPSSVEMKEVARAIKELDSDEYEVRQNAQKKLEGFGARAVDAITDALATATAERRTRLQAVLKRALERGGRKPVTADAVRTSKMEIKGCLQLAKIPVKTRFGLLDIDFEDLDCIRWLAYGERQEVQLEAWKSISEWIDTGVDAVEGEELAVSATGQINCGGNIMTAAGSNAWGNTQPYLVGTLIAKVGEGGKPFQVGDAQRTVAATGERIYLRVWVQPNMLGRNMQASYTGEYKAVVATGSQASSVEVNSQE
jgi:hypothetical protein